MSAGRRYAPHVPSDTVVIAVRVTPRGSRDALIGWQDGALRIRLAAPPVEGRANDALVRFLARVADLPAGRVRITGGLHSRDKRVLFEGIEPALLCQRLGIPDNAPIA